MHLLRRFIMEYIKRDLERKFLHMSSAFKAVMVVGARQVGKSTMLKHLAEGQNRTYVTMDDRPALPGICGAWRGPPFGFARKTNDIFFGRCPGNPPSRCTPTGRRFADGECPPRWLFFALPMITPFCWQRLLAVKPLYRGLEIM